MAVAQRAALDTVAALDLPVPVVLVQGVTPEQLGLDVVHVELVGAGGVRDEVDAAQRLAQIRALCRFHLDKLDARARLLGQAGQDGVALGEAAERAADPVLLRRGQQAVDDELGKEAADARHEHEGSRLAAHGRRGDCSRRGGE